jgi:hypothetical protein
LIHAASPTWGSLRLLRVDTSHVLQPGVLLVIPSLQARRDAFLIRLLGQDVSQELRVSIREGSQHHAAVDFIVQFAHLVSPEIPTKLVSRLDLKAAPKFLVPRTEAKDALFSRHLADFGN